MKGTFLVFTWDPLCEEKIQEPLKLLTFRNRHLWPLMQQLGPRNLGPCTLFYLLFYRYVDKTTTNVCSNTRKSPRRKSTLKKNFTIVFRLMSTTIYIVSEFFFWTYFKVHPSSVRFTLSFPAHCLQCCLFYFYTFYQYLSVNVFFLIRWICSLNWT